MMKTPENQLREVLDLLKEAFFNGDHSSVKKSEHGVSVTVSETLSEDKEVRTISGESALIIVHDGQGGFNQAIVGEFSMRAIIAYGEALQDIHKNLIEQMLSAKKGE